MTRADAFFESVRRARAGITPPDTALQARITACLAIIDEYNASPPGRQGGVAQRNYEQALDRLGRALHELHGPLPPETK